jgi:2-hydroxy-3-keto-5-methylthiopentenyl-1-phosphate phosphatase
LVEIFVDYDGTITDQDGFDALVRFVAGDGPWKAIEDRLDRDEISVREALREQAHFIAFSLDEAAQVLHERVPFDTSFAEFVAWARAHDIPLTIVSSGVDELIARGLQRHGLSDVPVIANSVVRDAQGRWVMRFRDPVPNGTDKAALVRAARERGARTIFIGDGRSDFEAALQADVRFAKRGAGLARFLEQKKVAFSTFSSFHEILAQWAPVCR